MCVSVCARLPSTEEKRTAQALRSRLWELLAPAGLAPAPGSSAWLHGYRQQLQQAGADEDTQRRATLLQLWATQVGLSLGRLLELSGALTPLQHQHASRQNKISFWGPCQSGALGIVLTFPPYTAPLSRDTHTQMVPRPNAPFPVR